MVMHAAANGHPHAEDSARRSEEAVGGVWLFITGVIGMWEKCLGPFLWISLLGHNLEKRGSQSGGCSNHIGGEHNASVS